MNTKINKRLSKNSLYSRRERQVKSENIMLLQYKTEGNHGTLKKTKKTTKIAWKVKVRENFL